MKNNIEESIKSILESTFVLNDWLHLNETEYIEIVTNNLLKLLKELGVPVDKQENIK